ncbi:MAG: hypothetical protein ACQCN3_02865 [Candidatus Bathyarchaeia archaeon]|jgi:hypothetical protein
MKKVKILLTLLSVIIMVAPITAEVLIYQNDLVGLVIPPEIANLLKGDNTNNNIGTVTGDTSNTPFEPPMLSGEPQYFPENNTVKFTYNFTNPLNTEINITTLQAEVVCHDHGFPLGNVGIDPATLEPGQTIDITAFGVLSDEALEHIATQHAGQSSLNADFKNLDIEMAGVTIQMDLQQYVGNIPIPIEYIEQLRWD